MFNTDLLLGTAMATIANLHSVHSESFLSLFTLLENTIDMKLHPKPLPCQINWKAMSNRLVEKKETRLQLEPSQQNRARGC